MGGGSVVPWGLAPLMTAALLPSLSGARMGAIDVHCCGKLAAGRSSARGESGEWEIR